MSNDEQLIQTAIVNVNAGGGGEDSCHFVDLLYTMLTKYCSSQDCRVILNFRVSASGGTKSVEFIVSGNSIYTKLRSLKGVHRLQEWDKKDKSKRKSILAAVDVIPMLEQCHSAILERDLKVETFFSGGAGGQNVNKTESAVRITHIPTGIVAACQQERSQIRNKAIALEILESKVAALRMEQSEKNVAELRGDVKQIVIGSQIITYMYCPLRLVKDHRSGYETRDVDSVLNGRIQPLIDAFLTMKH